MNNFWMGLLTQTSGAERKPMDRRQQVRSAICGLLLALVIGTVLFAVAVLTS